MHHQDMVELGPVNSVPRSPEYQDLCQIGNTCGTFADARGGVRQEGQTTAARGLL